MKLKLLMLIISTTILLVAATILAVNAVSFGRTDSWLNRAKDAGNPQQVAEFLLEYRTGLYQRNLVDGKYASVFRFPGSYMPMYIKAVDGLIGRAQALAIQSANDTSYQMGLLNLEKDLGDLDSAAYGVWFASGGFVVLIFVLLGAFAALVFIFIIAVTA